MHLNFHSAIFSEGCCCEFWKDEGESDPDSHLGGK